MNTYTEKNGTSPIETIKLWKKINWYAFGYVQKVLS